MRLRSPIDRTGRNVLRPGEARLLEPLDLEELLRGWLVHAHKARDRHESAARTFESRRAWFGGLAIAASALATSSVIASIAATPSTPAAGSGPSSIQLAVVAAVITLIGGVLAALQTFLDYAGRSARHHVAAVKYKAIIRELEQILTGKLDGPGAHEPGLIDDLRERLDALEESSPVVAGADWDNVEGRYRDIYLVNKAIELSPDKPLSTQVGYVRGTEKE
jgi:hypothetical protein